MSIQGHFASLVSSALEYTGLYISVAYLLYTDQNWLNIQCEIEASALTNRLTNGVSVSSGFYTNSTTSCVLLGARCVT